MRKRFLSAHALLAGLIVCAWSAAIVVSVDEAKAEEKSWKVHKKLAGEPKDPLGTKENSKKSKDVSGIACATASGFPRVCLVADDETQGVQIVILNDGDLVAGDFIRLIDNAHNGELVELDAEAVAYADGAFYVIGSHGRARHPNPAKEAKNKAKAEAARWVFRIRFDVKSVDLKEATLGSAPNIDRSSRLSNMIATNSKLKSSFDKELKDNGLTIEGLAVRGSDMYVGMRGPVPKDGKALIMSVPLAVVFDGAKGSVKLHQVALGKDTLGNSRGIRDLTTFDEQFLILAGPVQDPEEGTTIKSGDYAIYSWKEGKSGKEDKPGELLALKPYGGEKTKPEALLPLDPKGNRLRALLMFDGPEEGEPTPVEFDLK